MFHYRALQCRFNEISSTIAAEGFSGEPLAKSYSIAHLIQAKIPNMLLVITTKASNQLNS